jgi:hypothetical protein
MFLKLSKAGKVQDCKKFFYYPEKENYCSKDWLISFAMAGPS